MQVVPQFQQSKSLTRYFCVHYETMGSPQTMHSALHQPHVNEKYTRASTAPIAYAMD